MGSEFKHARGFRRGGPRFIALSSPAVLDFAAMPDFWEPTNKNLYKNTYMRRNKMPVPAAPAKLPSPLPSPESDRSESLARTGTESRPAAGHRDLGRLVRSTARMQTATRRA